jgi:outer membrane protein assembly factor BamA
LKPPEDVFVAYNSTFQFGVLEVLRRVANNIYLGERVVYSHSLTTFDIGTNPEEEINQFGLGILTEYDSRDDQFAPKRGSHAYIKTLSYSENLGSTNSYASINLVYNHYFPIGKRDILLTRDYSDISVGDVPFAGQNIAGRDDLRGYFEWKISRESSLCLSI